MPGMWNFHNLSISQICEFTFIYKYGPRSQRMRPKHIWEIGLTAPCLPVTYGQDPTPSILDCTLAYVFVTVMLLLAKKNLPACTVCHRVCDDWITNILFDCSLITLGAKRASMLAYVPAGVVAVHQCLQGHDRVHLRAVLSLVEAWKSCHPRYLSAHCIILLNSPSVQWTCSCVCCTTSSIVGFVNVLLCTLLQDSGVAHVSSSSNSTMVCYVIL